MTTEVSAVKAAQAQKGYSDDGKLYLGMKANEANDDPATMQVFASADIDKDNVISEEEIARYNGPTIKINYPERLGQIDGLKIVKSTRSRHIVPFSENYTKDNVVSFYPGLKLDQVDKAGRVTFSQIDKNKDGVLSVDELKEAEELSKKIDENCKKVTPRSDIKHGKVGTAFLSTIAGILSYAVVVELFSVAAAVAVPVGIAIGALVGLCMLGYYNNKNVKNDNIQQETEQMIADTGNEFGKFLYDTKLKPALEGKGKGRNCCR